MKLTVGKKSVIARNINSALWAISACLVIYGYNLFMNYLMKKYDNNLLELLDSYDISAIELVGIIFGGIVVVLMCCILIAQIYDILIGVHYFKRTETIIGSGRIVMSAYGFPYSKDFEKIVVSDVSEIEINQSSIERALGCGDIVISGYSNSNYSKTDFTIRIEGVDCVESVKDIIISKFSKK